MELEQVVFGLQIFAIVAITVGACLGPLIYTFWKDRKNK